MCHCCHQPQCGRNQTPSESSWFTCRKTDRQKEWGKKKQPKINKGFMLIIWYSSELKLLVSVVLPLGFGWYTMLSRVISCSSCSASWITLSLTGTNGDWSTAPSKGQLSLNGPLLYADFTTAPTLITMCSKLFSRRWKNKVWTQHVWSGWFFIRNLVLPCKLVSSQVNVPAARLILPLKTYTSKYNGLWRFLHQVRNTHHSRADEPDLGLLDSRPPVRRSVFLLVCSWVTWRAHFRARCLPLLVQHRA